MCLLLPHGLAQVADKLDRRLDVAPESQEPRRGSVEAVAPDHVGERRQADLLVVLREDLTGGGVEGTSILTHCM